MAVVERELAEDELAIPDEIYTSIVALGLEPENEEALLRLAERLVMCRDPSIEIEDSLELDDLFEIGGLVVTDEAGTYGVNQRDQLVPVVTKRFENVDIDFGVGIVSLDYTPESNSSPTGHRRAGYSVGAIDSMRGYVLLVEAGLLPRPQIIIGTSNPTMLNFAERAGLMTAQGWLERVFEEDYADYYGTDTEELTLGAIELLADAGLPEDRFVGLLAEAEYWAGQIKIIDEEVFLRTPEWHAYSDFCSSIYAALEDLPANLEEDQIRFLEYVFYSVDDPGLKFLLSNLTEAMREYNGTSLDNNEDRAYGFYEELKERIDAADTSRLEKIRSWATKKSAAR